MLTKGKIFQSLPWGKASEGEYIHDVGYVDIKSAEQTGVDRINVYADVECQYKDRQFNTAVYLDNDGDIFGGQCNCGQNNFCEHAAAVCFSYAQCLASGDDLLIDDSFDSWIDEIETEAPAVKVEQKNSEFIIYRLTNHNRDGFYSQVSPNKAYILKSGKVSKGKYFHQNFFIKACEGATNNLDLDINAVDISISEFLPMFITQTHGGSSDFKDLSGRIGYQLLMSLVESGRCYWGDQRTPLKFSDDIYTPEFQWEDGYDENSLKLTSELKPRLDNLSEGYTFYGTDPVLVIDTTGHKMQRLDPSFDLQLLGKLLDSPEIPIEQAERVHRVINMKIPGVIPVPNHFKSTIIEVEPLPVLKVCENVNDSSRYISLVFDYDSHEVDFYPRVETKSIVEHETALIINRNLKAENDAKNILEVQSEFDYQDSDVSLVLGPSKGLSKQDSLKSWMGFLDNTVGKLEKAGWRVVFEDDFQLSFSPSSDVSIESINSNDWFSLSFEFDVGGKKRSLVPLVSQIISEVENFDNAPDELIVEVAPNEFTNINLKAFMPVVKTILQLFDHKQKDGTLKIGAYNAHLLGELNQGVQWKGDTEILDIANKLNDFEGIENITMPKALKASLRGYQSEGVDWLHFLDSHRFSGVLADDMGLGKTLQTLALLLSLKKRGELTGTSLVVVPTSLLYNWMDEIEKFTPGLKSTLLYGPDRDQTFKKLKSYDVAITTYGNMARDIKRHVRRKYHYVVIDEAQNIKNPKTKAARAICSLKCTHRLALSGTPIENHLSELWSMFNFLMPGFLRAYSEFIKNFQTPIEKHGDVDRLEILKIRVRPFIMRRKKEDVAKDLPPKTILVKYVSFDKKQAAFYESVRISVEEEVSSAIAQRGVKGAQFNVLNALGRMRQVCCDPRIINIDTAQEVGESAKLDILMGMIDEFQAQNNKVLIFSNYTSMLSIIGDTLESKGVDYFKLIGDTPAKARGRMVKDFNQGKCGVFLISLKAGGTGLNLVGADTVVHYDPWWNPAAEDQATDRAHRIGQDKNVNVFKLVTLNTIEENIVKLQYKKRELSESIYADGTSKDGLQLSTESLLKILRSEDF